MRTNSPERAHRFPLAASLLASVFLLAACAGTWVRNASNSARLSLPEVERHLKVGLDAGHQLLELSTADVTRLNAAWGKVKGAVEAADRYALVGTPLTELRTWSLRGVDVRLSKRELGPHSANSVRNQITQFWELTNRLAQH